MEIIEITENYPQRVRSLLGVGEDILSDSTIKSFDISEISELAVKYSVPDWESIITGTDEKKKEIISSCLVYQTAVDIYPTAKKAYIKLQQTTHAKIEYFQDDTDSLLDMLKARLALLYEQLTEEMYSGFKFDITNPRKRYRGGLFP